MGTVKVRLNPCPAPNEAVGSLISEGESDHVVFKSSFQLERFYDSKYLNPAVPTANTFI